MRAFVFPGQGAQTIGMGRDLADTYPDAKAIFDEVDDALGEKLSTLIWEGEQDTLTLTQNAQPALMATSLAVMAALKSEGVGVDAASFVAGHSLGEYSALAAAGAISVSDTARLLRARGLAMQEAVPVGVGAMAALLGLDFQTAKDVAAAAAEGDVCQAANDNDPSQVVVSGHKAAVERAVVLGRGAEVDATDLVIVTGNQLEHMDEGGLVSLAVSERRHILNVLERVGGNKTHACKVLGIGRGTLYKKLEEYGAEVNSTD